MKLWIQEALGFVTVSACALVIDVTLLHLRVRYFSWWYLAAATVSFVAGLTLAYALSVSLAFKYRRLKKQRLEFASLAAVGVAINAAVMSFGVKYLGLHYLLDKCGAAAFKFFGNFVASRELLFVPRGSA